MRAHVYRNLNVGLWSVRDPSAGRVVKHTERVEVVDAACRVQPGGLARALKRHVRNVHAYVIGDVKVAPARRRGPWQRFRYNPFRAGHFTLDGDSRPLLGAARMRFDVEGSWCRGPRFEAP